LIKIFKNGKIIEYKKRVHYKEILARHTYYPDENHLLVMTM